MSEEATMRNRDLIGNTDGLEWAKRFVRQFNGQRIGNAPEDIDERTMLTWFAVAIESGRDAGLADATPSGETACARGDHDNCDNEEANWMAAYAEDYIIVCVCSVCQGEAAE